MIPRSTRLQECAGAIFERWGALFRAGHSPIIVGRWRVQPVDRHGKSATGEVLGVRPRFGEEASEVRRPRAMPLTITTDEDVDRTGISRAGVSTGKTPPGINTCGPPIGDCTLHLLRSVSILPSAGSGDSIEVELFGVHETSAVFDTGIMR